MSFLMCKDVFFHRLDIVVGKQPLYTMKEIHTDHKYTMAMRLQKVERQVKTRQFNYDLSFI